MNEKIYPLTFEPVLRDYIWGGRNLEKLGRKLPPGKTAESWEISGHPSSPTQVDNGSLAGKPLTEVLEIWGLDLVGHRSQAMLDRGKFPLLIKLLDANRALSVQVHPDDEYAGQHENGELGKTEMWYIIDAEPGAELIYGLKPSVTPQSFREALEAGELERCLHYLPVEADDAIFIPSGSLHAILAGIILAEIQQNSDTTYRVYDWNRVDDDGKPRPLHVDKAMDVINFDQIEPGPFEPQLLEARNGLRRMLITASDYFNVEKVTLSGADTSFNGQGDGSTFEIWGIMSGQAQVNWAGSPLQLSAIRFTLLPAALGEFEIQSQSPATFLRAYVPGA